VKRSELIRQARRHLLANGWNRQQIAGILTTLAPAFDAYDRDRDVHALTTAAKTWRTRSANPRTDLVRSRRLRVAADIAEERAADIATKNAVKRAATTAWNTRNGGNQP